MNATVYVVSEGFREPWQSTDVPPSRFHVLAIYSNETTARTHVASLIRTVGRVVRIEAFELDAPCTERATP